MKMYRLICPNCEAPLEFSEDREIVFCQYCGQKILLHNSNKHVYEYTYHEINDAEISAASAYENIRVKELEIQANRERHEQKLKRIVLLCWLSSLVLLFICKFAFSISIGYLFLDLIIGAIFIPRFLKHNFSKNYSTEDEIRIKELENEKVRLKNLKTRLSDSTIETLATFGFMVFLFVLYIILGLSGVFD